MKSQGRLFYCLGAARSGTTWLHDVLSQHPEISIPPQKEVHYWDWIRPPHITNPTVAADLRFAESSVLYRLGSLAGRVSSRINRKVVRCRYQMRMRSGMADDHLSYMQYLDYERKGSVVVGDMTPAYALLSSDTYGEMLSLNPDARFVFVMRDPCERFVSDVRFGVIKRGESTNNKEIDLNNKIKEEISSQGSLAVLKSQYEKTIENLEAAIPPDQIMYLFYENMFSENTIIALERFLGLQHEVHVAGDRVNSSAQVKLSIDVSAESWKLMKTRFAPTYKKLQDKFGENIPWECD